MTICCALTCYTLDCCNGAGPSTPYPAPRTTPSPPPHPPPHPPEHSLPDQPLKRNPLDPLNSPIGHINEHMKTTSDNIMGLQTRLTRLEKLVAARSGLYIKGMDSVYVELAAYEDSDVGDISAHLDRIERDLLALSAKGKYPAQRVFEAYNFVCVLIQHLLVVQAGIYDLRKKVLAVLGHNTADSGLDVPSLAHQLQKAGHPLKNLGYIMGESNMWGSGTGSSMEVQCSEDKGEYCDTYDTTMTDLTNMTQMRVNAKGKEIEKFMEDGVTDIEKEEIKEVIKASVEGEEKRNRGKEGEDIAEAIRLSLL